MDRGLRVVDRGYRHAVFQFPFFNIRVSSCQSTEVVFLLFPGELPEMEMQGDWVGRNSMAFKRKSFTRRVKREERRGY